MAFSKHDPHLIISKPDQSKFRHWGFYDRAFDSRPKILVSSGFGYGNVGDEAQVGACIKRWQRICTGASITLLSPSPPYTAALHQCRVEWAPRVAWFRSNTSGPYFDSEDFSAYWRRLRMRLEITARCVRRDFPFSLCTPREARILQLILEHDIIHISGGGFLTGKTRSRLWDNCLLMRMCQLLGKPYMLTGHNIGVFQSKADKRITKMGLKKALFIGLRDKGISESALAEIGIKGPHISSSCDDALFCERLKSDKIASLLKAQGIDPCKPWAAVNFHHWGQPEETRESIENRFAEVCDYIVSKHSIQIVFIAMAPSDSEPEAKILRKMHQPAVQFPYSPDYRVVRGIIADSKLVFTMKHHPIVFAQGESVPVVSIALDSYYYHKNKGALDNTDHGIYLSNKEDFLSDNILVRIFDAINNGIKIQNRINLWTDSMREIEMLPYANALNKISVNP